LKKGKRQSSFINSPSYSSSSSNTLESSPPLSSALIKKTKSSVIPASTNVNSYSNNNVSSFSSSNTPALPSSSSSSSSSSTANVLPLPYLSEKELLFHLNQISTTLNSISVKDANWTDRYNAFRLLHSIAVTPITNSNIDVNDNNIINNNILYFCSHPIYLSTLSSSSFKPLLLKQFSDARSSMIKSLCDFIKETIIL
jgi:hypothetical protein